MLTGENWLLGWVIYRCILQVLILPDILFDLFGKVYIGGMSGPVGNHMSLNRITDQCQVANYIQQFMPGRFIRKPELQVIEVPATFYFHILTSECFRKPVHFIWGGADEVFTEAWGRKWANGFPQATFDLLPQARHFLQETHGAEIAEIFLGRVAEGRP